MRVQVILLAFLFGIYLLGCRAAASPSLFGNMTYIVGEYPHYQKVKLVDGKYMDWLTHVYYEGNFVYGDFNHDGLKDAAVVITESGGGSGESFILAFLINDGVKLVHRSLHYLDDAVEIISLREHKGNVIITMLVNNEKDYARHPVKRVTKIYEYTTPMNFSAAENKPEAQKTQ